MYMNYSYCSSAVSKILTMPVYEVLLISFRTCIYYDNAMSVSVAVGTNGSHE